MTGKLYFLLRICILFQAEHFPAEMLLRTRPRQLEAPRRQHSRIEVQHEIGNFTILGKQRKGERPGVPRALLLQTSRRCRRQELRARHDGLR